MRRYAASFSGAGLLAGLGASAALAAASTTSPPTTPVPSKLFSGRGSDYLNNAPKWSKDGAARFHFETSNNSGRILNFNGSYSFYCGGGSASVKAGFVTVHSGGAFDYRFAQRSKGDKTHTAYVAYVEISGRFLAGGKSANVSYLVDFVFKGEKVPNPYDTSNPKKLGCASWVKGVAKAG